MEKLEDSLKFKLWMQSLKENNITVKKVEEKAIFRRGNGEVLFAFLTVDAIDEDKRALPSAVLLRGDFVSVLTCLIDKDSKKKYLLLVKQKRVGTGGYFHEHPAGMCDNESDPFKVAVKEVEEETGLQISENQIIHLHKGKLYNSPGLLDEAGYFFACEVEMSGEEIKQFHDKTMGEEHEHEYIQTVICPFEEALSLIKNANGLLSIMLYQDYCNKN